MSKPVDVARAYSGGAAVRCETVNALWAELKKANELSLARLALARLRRGEGLLDELPADRKLNPNCAGSTRNLASYAIRAMDTLMERAQLADYGDLAARMLTRLMRGLMFLQRRDEVVTITRNGKPVAIIVTAD